MDTETTSQSHEPPAESYALAQLCLLADMPIRTVRYYIQIALVNRPAGGTRAARYDSGHLQQLLLIKKWTQAGLALERIREILHGQAPALAPPSPAAGSVEVRSHISLAPGLELVIAPQRAGLSPEQMREFARAVIAAYAHMNAASSPTPDQQ